MTSSGFRISFRKLFSFDQRFATQVAAVQIQQVESEEHHWMAARQAGDGARFGYVDAPLQQFKAGPALRVERGDLPIYDGLPGAHLMRQD